MAAKTRIIRIGNSQGTVQAVRRPRAGWAEAARTMRQRNDDRLPDEPAKTRFDEAEWEWR